MSEIAKCPCCGGPVQQYDDPYASSFIACNSENDECMFVCDIKNFTLIAAAMELAKAEAELDASVRFLFENEAIDDDTPEFSEWTATHRAVMKQHMTTKDRVLEVFGK